MNAKSSVVAARLVRGTGTPVERFFRPGTKERLFSVGQNAAWHVIAPGVEPVHAFIYFDGQDLWAFGVASGTPLELDGHALGETWTQLVPPAVLTLGEAEIAFEKVATVSARGGAETERRLYSHGDKQEATIVAQLPIALFDPDAALRSDPPPTSAESAPRAEDLASDSKRKSGRGRQVRRLIAGFVVLGVLGALVVGIAKHRIRLPFQNKANAALHAKKAKPAAAASSAPAGSAKPADSHPAAEPSATASASGSIAPQESSAAADDDDSSDDDITLERRAANALVSGDDAVALRCYTELAKSHPDQPVFREAARILRDKKRGIGL
jgi:hypothetical protein